MLEKRTFCFEFIKDLVIYHFSFDAMVDDTKAKQLYSVVLNDLYDSGFSCKHYIVVFEHNLSRYIHTYGAENIECSARYYYHGCSGHDWNINDEERYSEYTSGKREDFKEHVKDWDYYFLISLETAIYDEEYLDDDKTTHLTIIKRIKDNDFYITKTFQQRGHIAKECSWAEDRVDFEFSFKVIREAIDEGESSSEKTYLRLEHDFSTVGFDKPVETVLPLEFDGIQYINTFTEYLNVLINVDSFRTIEDIQKFISTKQLVK